MIISAARLYSVTVSSGRARTFFHPSKASRKVPPPGTGAVRAPRVNLWCLNGLASVSLLNSLQRSHIGPQSLHPEFAIRRALVVKVNFKVRQQKSNVVHNCSDVT